jgi:hypothetical protein
MLSNLQWLGTGLDEEMQDVEDIGDICFFFLDAGEDTEAGVSPK